MRFLVDEDLPRSTADLLRRFGYEAIDVRDVGLRGAKDSHIAAYARRERFCLITGDFDFSDIRNYPPGEYAGLVVLKIPRTATTSFILNLVEGFLQNEDVVSQIGGKLAIVESGRFRIREG